MDLNINVYLILFIYINNGRIKAFRHKRRKQVNSGASDQQREFVF